jgi:predicted HicB family RNase H-like nuclease
MIYKGYEGVLEVAEEAGELFGTVKGLRDVITFVGATIEEARESFEKSVDFYLERCAATGKKPDRPYAGVFLVRVSPETHRGLERIADRRKADLDELVSEVLDAYVRMDNSGGVSTDSPPKRAVARPRTVAEESAAPARRGSKRA